MRGGLYMAEFDIDQCSRDDIITKMNTLLC